MSSGPWFKIIQGGVGTALVLTLIAGALLGEGVEVAPVWLAILAIPVGVTTVLDFIEAAVRFKLRAMRKDASND